MTTNANHKKQTGDPLPSWMPKLASTPESRALVRHYYERRKLHPIRKHFSAGNLQPVLVEALK